MAEPEENNLAFHAYPPRIECFEPDGAKEGHTIRPAQERGRRAPPGLIETFFDRRRTSSDRKMTFIGIAQSYRMGLVLKIVLGLPNPRQIPDPNTSPSPPIKIGRHSGIGIFYNLLQAICRCPLVSSTPR